VVEWTSPGDDGLSECPAHPESGRFRANRGGCPSCRLAPAADDEVSTPEADRILADLAVAEAEARGCPDMFDLEKYVDRARADCRREQKACRDIALKLEQTAQSVLDGDRVVMERDREGSLVEADQDRAAQHWFAEAAKYRMAVAKSIDTQAKLLKMAMTPAAARYRAKQLKHRAQLKGGAN
jgi:hypothetical protein